MLKYNYFSNMIKCIILICIYINIKKLAFMHLRLFAFTHLRLLEYLLKENY